MHSSMHGIRHILCTLCIPTAGDAEKEIFGAARVYAAAKMPARFRVTSGDVNRYFSRSAFLGNSVSVGLSYFFASKPRGYLGSPRVISRVSYSFRNDFYNNSNYMLHYRGVPMHAQYAVKACRARRVFIMMGTNDQFGPVSSVFNDYKRYINAIRRVNPGVVIYIESMTPCLRSRGNINNPRIHALNRYLKKYASSMKDVYFIDIATPLSDSSGRLRSSCSSDGFVHISHTGYQIWVDTVAKFVKNQLQRTATARYRTALIKKSLNRKNIKLSEKRYRLAVKTVSRLENSRERDALKKELRSLRIRIRKLKKAEKAAKKEAENKAENSAESGAEVLPVPAAVTPSVPASDAAFSE